MQQHFHISFPFKVAESHHRPGEHPPLCAYPIPLAHTVSYRAPALPTFKFIRQYYANALLALVLLEASGAGPFTAVMRPAEHPAYLFAVMLEGSLRYDYPSGETSEMPPPGTVYFARLCDEEYPIHFPTGSGKLLLIALHTAQLDLVGEDFKELASLADAVPLGEDIISPPIPADSILMRRLIRLVNPVGITRRKDFNHHLMLHLPRVCSAVKGILRGKSQLHYDTDKLAAVIAFIDQEEREHGFPPDLSSVLDFACVSADKLERLFHSGPGITPAAYLLARKLEAIKGQLLTTDHPVYLIAQQFGYSDSAAMNKPFKKHFGLSPLQLRRQQQSS